MSSIARQETDPADLGVLAAAELLRERRLSAAELVAACLRRIEARNGEIVVSDDGPGIAPELLERVFDPFTQLAPGDKDAQGGLGVGLALVRRIVELHGGRISVESPGPGRGATFAIHLPAAPASASEPP